VEWAPCDGLHPERQVNQVDGPPGRGCSWYRHAATRILSEERDAFFRDWAYDVRPATDDSPYFHDFFRWRSLPLLIRSYGEHWLRRAELGYVVLVFALAQAVVCGAVLILLPLVLRKRRGAGRGKLATCGYFALLGLAYLMMEMTFMLRFSRFLGDPLWAAAIVLAGFLVSSGLGSAASGRYGGGPCRAIGLAAIGLGVVAVGYALALDAALRGFVGLPLGGRAAVALALTAPPAFLMGWFFPNGLALVERGAPGLTPWAWGVNGFASVAASPLAVLLAIAVGYRAVLLLVGVLYLLAGVLAHALPAAPKLDGPSGAD
jgi:hypothetical protein